MTNDNDLLKQMIFVFGSNLAGRHGKGAALFAKQHYGAEHGVGIGRTGRSYAIPTKDAKLQTLPLHQIDHWISLFIGYAKQNPQAIFLLTPIGTGLAGYTKKDIGNILKRHECYKLSNVVLASTWLESKS